MQVQQKRMSFLVLYHKVYNANISGSCEIYLRNATFTHSGDTQINNYINGFIYSQSSICTRKMTKNQMSLYASKQVTNRCPLIIIIIYLCRLVHSLSQSVCNGIKASVSVKSRARFDMAVKKQQVTRLTMAQPIRLFMTFSNDFLKALMHLPHSDPSHSSIYNVIRKKTLQYLSCTWPF